MVYLGRDVVTGRKRYSSKTVKGGKQEAQRALATLVAQAEAGSLAKTKATVGELLEDWFDQAKGDLSPKDGSADPRPPTCSASPTIRSMR